MLIRLALILAALNFTACSHFQRRSTNPEPNVTLKDVQEAQSAMPDSKGDADAQAKAQEMREAVAAAAQHIQETHGKETRKAGPVPSEKSLGWLKNGNTRYTTGHLRSDGASSSDRARLTRGQKPHAIILSCSDSRVPPEVVFDQKLGEIYVVRTLGEALDNNVIASIEYGVQQLGSNLIVVMGHEACGAVKATLSALQGGETDRSSAWNALIADLKPRLQQFANTPQSPAAIDESWANVSGVSHDLLERSQILRDAVASGEVKIVRAMYHMESGKVEWQ
ncbi:MAG: carbonic anhydrase [Bdellovibrio sp.]|nr:carbonic anhydrase [Bdellovibrio sp.]